MGLRGCPEADRFASSPFLLFSSNEVVGVLVLNDMIIFCGLASSPTTSSSPPLEAAIVLSGSSQFRKTDRVKARLGRCSASSGWTSGLGT